MDRHFYEKVFSTERMKKYFDHYQNDDEKAIIHYRSNIELSESFYSVLSMFEVALRNSLNRELTTYFGTEDWYLRMESVPGLRNLEKLEETHSRIIMVMGWLNKDLPTLAGKIDRVPEVLNEVKKKL